jgi:hypothetical protein
VLPRNIAHKVVDQRAVDAADFFSFIEVRDALTVRFVVVHIAALPIFCQTLSADMSKRPSLPKLHPPDLCAKAPSQQ